MKKIVLLSGDTKLLRELTIWLKELSDEVTVDSMSNVEEFQRRYCTAGEPESPADPNSTDTDPKKKADAGELDLEALGALSQRHFGVSLLIVDLESLPKDAVFWVLETKDAMSRHGYSKDDSPTRFALVGYGEEDFDVDRYRHDAVDELILKPIDKALFLQKIELHLSEGHTSRASFLFRQKTELVIEMAKDTWIESVSEFGFVIRNPAPLAAGVYAKIYSSLFGEGAFTGLIGRVHRSERHPSIDNAYLCYMTYHGITNSQLTSVRKMLRHDRTPPPLAGIPLPEIRNPVKHVVVIDMNSDARETVSDALKSNFHNVEFHGFPSYTAFLRYCTRQVKILENSGQNADEIAAASSAGSEGAALRLVLAGSSEINFLVDANTCAMVRFDPSPKRGSKVLGIDSEEMVSHPTDWLDLFDSEDKEQLEEFFGYLRAGQAGQIGLVARMKDGTDVRLRIKGRIEKSAENESVMLAHLNLRELNEEEWRKTAVRSSEGVKNFMIDAVYIDGSFLGDSPAATIDGMVELMRKARLIESRESLLLTIMGDEKSRIQPDEFKLKTVHDFMFKPLDRKMTIGKAMLLIRGLFPKTDSADISHRRAGVPGRITKEVLMEELSEFGLQIRHQTPLRENTFLRFFSPVFLSEGADGVLGRCLSSMRDPDTGVFHCFFTFFGVSDGQLKHIRNWIRGDYAARKEKSGVV